MPDLGLAATRRPGLPPRPGVQGASVSARPVRPPSAGAQRPAAWTARWAAGVSSGVMLLIIRPGENVSASESPANLTRFSVAVAGHTSIIVGRTKWMVEPTGLAGDAIFGSFGGSSHETCVALLVCLAVCVFASPALAAEVTLKGNITCPKCELKLEGQKTCATVVVVKEGGKDVIYYFDEKAPQGAPQGNLQGRQGGRRQGRGRREGRQEGRHGQGTEVRLGRQLNCKSAYAGRP